MMTLPPPQEANRAVIVWPISTTDYALSRSFGPEGQSLERMALQVSLRRSQLMATDVIDTPNIFIGKLASREFTVSVLYVLEGRGTPPTYDFEELPEASDE